MTPDILEAELRDRLHRVAARSGSSVGDDRAAAEAVLHRRRAEHRQLLVGLAVAACVALVVVAVPLLLAGLRSAPGGQAAEGEVWDAPVRGSLAGDRAFLDSARLLDWAQDPAPELADRRVAFAGDVPGGRWVLVVGPVGQQLVGQWFTAPAGAPPVDLVADPSPTHLDPGDPVTRTAGAVPGGALLVLTEPGDVVQVAERAVVDADGTVRRDYTTVPAVDGVAVTEVGSTVESGIAARYRVLRDGAVRAQGSPAADQWPARTFDPPELPPLLPGGGTPDGTAVEQAIAEVAAPLGLAEDEVRPALLWAGPVPGPGGATADAAVLALTLPSGAVVVSTAYADMAPDGSGVSAWCGARTYPAGVAVGDLAVVAACDVRGRSGSAVLRSYVVVSTRPADRVELLRADGMVLAEQTLVDGSAVVRDSGAVEQARLRTAAGPGPQQPVTRGAPDSVFDRIEG